MACKTFFLVGLSFLLFFSSFGQDFTTVPEGKFLKEKLKLGEEIPYVLTFEHPQAMEMIFADSTLADFTPFEVLRTDYFTTQTDSLSSRDSIVYHLLTFDIQEKYSLKVPVFYLSKDGKQLPVFPSESTIEFESVIHQVPDSLILHENTTMANIKKEVNYPYILASVVLFVEYAFIFYLIFGKKISRTLQLKSLENQHKKFLQEYEQLTNDVLSKEGIEHAIICWKTYSEVLLGIPILSFTTKEISQVIESQFLHEALKKIDKSLYSGEQDENLKESFSFLKEYTQNIYEAQVEAIKMQS